MKLETEYRLKAYFMRLMIFLCAVLLFIVVIDMAHADTVYHQTYPGTTLRDYSQPSIVVRDNQVYQTYPGTTLRDYSKPGLIIERRDSYGPSRPIRNQYRIDQPLQQGLRYVWPAED